MDSSIQMETIVVILDELALAGELLRLEGASDEDADENGPLCRTLDDEDHVTHGFSI